MKPIVVVAVLVFSLLGAGLLVLSGAPSKTLSLNTTGANATSTGDGGVLSTLPDVASLKPKPGTFPYKEIVKPAGFVNTDKITIGELVGKKVILVDFLTYSCINCQRTFPYINAWYDRYKDQGLEVIGIHTPEFAFEKDIKNVREAMKKFGITHPIVLDNEYGTWGAYGNQYWPRKYLIDIYGNVVYDHIGEGGYEETEMKIRELLEERAKVLGESSAVQAGGLAVSTVPKVSISSQSPETYFGSSRNEYFANGTSGKTGVQTLSLPSTLKANALYLAGTWNITPEYAESVAGNSVSYTYSAREVYIVADADVATSIEVWQDGVLVGNASGADVQKGVLTVKESRLYKLIRNSTSGEHMLELRTKGKVRFFAFTFG